MTTHSETLKQDLDHLSHKQLQQVDDFIAFLKFQASRRDSDIDPDLLAILASEFAAADQALSEEDMSDLTALLDQQDQP